MNNFCIAKATYISSAKNTNVFAIFVVGPDQLASSDVDLLCLQKQGISRFSRTRVNICILFIKKILEFIDYFL